MLIIHYFHIFSSHYSSRNSPIINTGTPLRYWNSARTHILRFSPGLPGVCLTGIIPSVQVLLALYLLPLQIRERIREFERRRLSKVTKIVGQTCFAGNLVTVLLHVDDARV